MFAPKTLVKFKRACVAEVRQLKIAKSLPLTLSGKSCTNLIAYQLVVESAVSCEAGDDHATMELSGSGYSTAFTQEDLELVNLQSDQVHQKLSSATLEETPNGILAKLFAPGICAELSDLFFQLQRSSDHSRQVHCEYMHDIYIPGLCLDYVALLNAYHSEHV